MVFTANYRHQVSAIRLSKLLDEKTFIYFRDLLI